MVVSRTVQTVFLCFPGSCHVHSVCKLFQTIHICITAWDENLEVARMADGPIVKGTSKGSDA